MDSLMKKLANHNDAVNEANPGWSPYIKTPDNFIKFNESFIESIVIDVPNPELHAQPMIKAKLQSDGTFLIETWVKGPSADFYLDDLVVSEDQFIQAVLDLFKRTTIDAVQEIYAQGNLRIRPHWRACMRAGGLTN